VLSNSRISNFSTPLLFGIGEAPSGDACGGAPDINGDTKINLVDFSIFLLSWQSDDPASDFSCDGIVNLADFSIMLFNWTG